MGNLKLTRQQLASFLKDPEQIKQFERLFSVVNEVEGNTDTAGTALEAISATAKANAAFSSLTAQIESLEVENSLLKSKINQSLANVNDFKNSLETIFFLLHQKKHKRSRYGHFYDTTTQIAPAINTATAITFNTSDISSGVYLGSPASRIYVDTEGVYNFLFTLQLDKTSGGTGIFWVWPRINGVDVPNSALQIQIQGNNAEIFSGANFFFDLKANDYTELMFSVNDVTVQLQTFAASPPVPAVPSIIVSVSNNIKGES